MGSEEDRLTQIYRLYGSVIYARCRKLLNNDASAEDAAQETFVRVYRHLAKAPDPQEALAWIYRIATNYCLNEIRNRRTRPEPVEVLPEVPADGLDEERMGDRDLARRLIARAPE
jgi:RNA polymerase sigma-70 factor (ECF subfamily)